MAQTIATALSVRESRERSVRDALVDTLRDRTLLLVLDNCEHLIDVCAALVEGLLHEAPALRNRDEPRGPRRARRNRLPRSVVVAAGGTIPARAEPLIESEATQLFVDRAMAIDPGFTSPTTPPTLSLVSVGVSTAFRSRSSSRPRESRSSRRNRLNRGFRTDSGF